MNIFIDTEIWSFSQKFPKESRFSNKNDYHRSLTLHKKADKFLREQIKNNHIKMTYHQISEIFHVLGFRGQKMPLNWLNSFISKLLSSKFIKFFKISKKHVKEALKLSVESKIHIWDYLCVIPLIDNIDILYSCDKHFIDPTFQKLDAKILNPLDEWITL